MLEARGARGGGARARGRVCPLPPVPASPRAPSLPSSAAFASPPPALAPHGTVQAVLSSFFLAMHVGWHTMLAHNLVGMAVNGITIGYFVYPSGGIDELVSTGALHAINYSTVFTLLLTGLWREARRATARGTTRTCLYHARVSVLRARGSVPRSPPLLAASPCVTAVAHLPSPSLTVARPLSLDRPALRQT